MFLHVLSAILNNLFVCNVLCDTSLNAESNQIILCSARMLRNLLGLHNIDLPRELGYHHFISALPFSIMKSTCCLFYYFGSIPVGINVQLMCVDKGMIHSQCEAKMRNKVNLILYRRPLATWSV